MNKINIAELLKDCPSGMELDCISYDNVSFDKISDDKKATYPIFCYITDKEGNRSSISFTENGYESKRYGAKCVIFPKGKTTWEGFHRPFKNGDIVCYLDCIAIFKEWGEAKLLRTYVTAYLHGDSTVDVAIPLFGKSIRREVRLATEEEKAKLFQAIKYNGYKWNPESKTLEKLPKFKVGDRIRLKNSPNNIINIVTKINEDGSLNVNDYSWVIKYELQDKYELVIDNQPKFKVGDKITKIDGSRKGEIFYIDVDKYHVAVSNIIGIDVFFEDQDDWELVPDIKPKFKVGDIVCDDKRVYRIYDIDDTHYKSTYIQEGNSLCYFFPIHTQDRYRDVNCHFWVGDRITDPKKFIYLIKEVTLTGYILKDLKNTQITFEEARLYFVKVEDKFDISTLKPFDKVLYRMHDKDTWCNSFYSFYKSNHHFVTSLTIVKQCIPYEGNEHLLGTTDDCDEYFKTWK